MKGEIVALPTQVIPPENTPQKTRSESLVAHPRWSYKGPGETIRFEWQIGRWGWAGFAGDSARKYGTFSQPPSTEFQEFEAALPAISLSPLSPRDEPYDAEIWFKDKFADLRVIVENCVKVIVPEGYQVEIRINPSGAGSVTKDPDKEYYYDEVVKLTAIPNPGYRFLYWTVDSEPPVYGNPMNFLILSSRVITAHFVEAVAAQISVSLKNAPAGSFWQIVIAPKDKAYFKFATDLPMNAKASFNDLPANWLFPTLIDLIVYQWIVPGESVKQIYRIQSYWGPEHEYYQEVYIPAFGSYNFNFTTKQFEKVG